MIIVMGFFLLIICFSLMNSNLDIDESELELIFVYQHIRHGARGPSASYNSLFKNGIDEFRVNFSWKKRALRYRSKE